MTGPKRTAKRGQKRGVPLVSVLEAVEEKRSAKADAAELDALLAAGKRLRPPPTRLEAPTVSAGELALRRERRQGLTHPTDLWDEAERGGAESEADE